METDQLQLSGLSVRSQVDGICGHEAVAGDSHVADPRVHQDNRPEHPGGDRTLSSLIAPSGIRIRGQVDHAKFSEDLDLPYG